MRNDFSNAKSRFICMNRLEETSRQKNGRYTEEERQNWLGVLYSCLEAPNEYFFQARTHLNEKRKKQLASYGMKSVKFQRIVKQEREQHRFIYTYLVCIRDLFNKTESYPARKKDTTNPLAAKLWAALQEVLDKRIAENSKRRKFKGRYQEALKTAFQTKQNRLNHPVFFLFLPYYLFFELGKCEELISETEAFSVPQLDREGYNWSIRTSPIAATNKETYEQLDELYDLVEGTLCQALYNCEYHSIGQTFLSAGESDDDEIECAADFSVPLWSLDIWAKCFCEQFGTKLDALLSDMHQLFNLTLRTSSSQAKRTANKVLQNYENCRKELRGRTFQLSALLDALCNIYNLQQFYSDTPFDDTSLRQSINTLMDFLIETGVYLVGAAKNSPEENWLPLLQYGRSNLEQDEESGEYALNCSLVNPSRILYRAILMRSLADTTAVPKRYGLSEFLPYSKILQKVSNGLYRTLCSEKELRRDVTFWGGVKIELNQKYTPTLDDAFRVWSVWHMDSASRFKEYFQYLERQSTNLSAAISVLQPFEKDSVIVDLSTFDFSVGESDDLNECKQQLFNAIPELKKIFGQPKKCDDFTYACILYFLFRALRLRMCRQSFALCKKLLQLT